MNEPDLFDVILSVDRTIKIGGKWVRFYKDHPVLLCQDEINGVNENMRKHSI
jgi:hypothetical protein